MAHIHHLHVISQPLDVFQRTLQKQRVAHLHDQLVQLAADVLAAPVRRKNIHAITAAQAHLA